MCTGAQSVSSDFMFAFSLSFYVVGFGFLHERFYARTISNAVSGTKSSYTVTILCVKDKLYLFALKFFSRNFFFHHKNGLNIFFIIKMVIFIEKINIDDFNEKKWCPLDIDKKAPARRQPFHILFQMSETRVVFAELLNISSSVYRTPVTHVHIHAH